MKKLLLLVLTYGMYAGIFAQNPIEPCCSIISKNAKNNLVVARDKSTGRLYQFMADAMDIKAIKLNDAVTINSGKITSIGGATRTYATVKPDYAEPCCGVVSIEPDPAETCCAIVTFKNNTTGALLKFKAPKNISGTLKVFDPVFAEPIAGIAINYAEPVGANKMRPDGVEPISTIAIVQSPFGNSGGQMNSYGYPATSADETNNNEKPAEKWVVKKVNAKSGTGKLYVSLPKGAEWDMTIYAAGSSKVLSNTMLQTSFALLPGNYDLEINHIKITGVPVEKGNETRLKTGVLHITNSTSWTLYDAAKQTVLLNSTATGQRGLPIGKYKLTIMGQDTDIEIKDGETVTF